MKKAFPQNTIEYIVQQSKWQQSKEQQSKVQQGKNKKDTSKRFYNLFEVSFLKFIYM